MDAPVRCAEGGLGVANRCSRTITSIGSGVPSYRQKRKLPCTGYSCLLGKTQQRSIVVSQPPGELSGQVQYSVERGQEALIAWSNRRPRCPIAKHESAQRIWSLVCSVA